ITLSAEELSKVKLQLKWKNQFQFAGYYIAKERGFYKDAGFDVEILEAKDNKDVTDMVLNEEVDFAISDSVLVYDRLMGKEIVLLGAIFQETPFVLLSLKKSHIEKPSDLIGKKIMLDMNVQNNISILALLNKNNLSKDDVKLTPTTYNLNSLINKEVDLFTSYLSNEPYILKKKGIEYSYIQLSDYGFNFYGDILFTSKKFYKKNPQKAYAFYKATMEGWKYAFENID
ncbi:MAG: ABC transporter substrate-binding protein, partial [Campylobacterales bacterium]|nr:ABC transporter substrate-binding protein [Campylobacterales bacterium]